MDFKKILIILPILLVVASSGCTIPYTNICIPFLGQCDKVVEFENDVIIIKDFQALPQTVSPGQQIRLVAYVQNIGNEEVPQNSLNGDYKEAGITVDLYDYCEGLFSGAKVDCGGKQSDCTASGGCRCSNIDLLPGQIKEVSWTLTAGGNAQVPLRTECDLKMSVTYPYKTKSLTMITFIDYQEMQRQLNEGTFRQRDTYIVSGYGPAKPMITIEDQQPIPVQQGEAGTTIASFKVKNSGSGFLCRLDNDKKIVCDSKIPADKATISGVDGELSFVTEGECAFSGSNPKEDVTLIQKESPPMICGITLSEDVNLPKETTKHVTVDIEYMYEIRKEIKITIEPKT
jgi:archaellum component FlaG (FlaF/FlaG flagellin family)